MKNTNDTAITKEEVSEAPVLIESSVEVGDPKKKRSPLRIIVTVLAIIVALAALMYGALAVWAYYAFDPICTEIGDIADLSSLSDGFLKQTFAEVVTCTVDTSSLGERDVTIRLFGSFYRQIPVTVRDSVAPEFEVRKVEVVSGITAEAKDFVKSFSDRTEVTFSFANGTPAFDEVGDYEVVIDATDEGGNVSSHAAKLKVTDISFEMNVEFGASAEDIAKQLQKEHPEFDKADLDLIDPGEIGSCRVSALNEDTYYLFNVNIKDTTAPKAQRHSFDIRLGDKVAIDEFITDVEDLSPTTLTYLTEPDFKKLGTQRVKISVADDQGNERVYSSILSIHDFVDEVTLEAGFTLDELESKIIKSEGTGLHFDPSFKVLSLAVGENKVKLKGNFNDFDITVNVTDTVAPLLTVHDVMLLVNQPVTPMTFVTSSHDATQLKYSFDGGTVSTAVAGTYSVKVTATDLAGNKTSRTAMLTVILDTEAPRFTGLDTLSVCVGDAITLKNGVKAIDNIDGDIDFTVDSSSLNISCEGYYTVYYTAVDTSGNASTVGRTVVVSSIGQEKINQLCDSVLAGIINDSMGARDKAYAIFQWVTSNFRYSTSTSYLMGQYYNAAYSGFNIHTGNCYIYYAVSSSLLTRAGIENIMIQRNNPNKPHYWSLVKINGYWYHYDTCPHYAAYPFNSFLRTDADVIKYSNEQAIGYYSFDRNLYPATP